MTLLISLVDISHALLQPRSIFNYILNIYIYRTTLLKEHLYQNIVLTDDFRYGRQPVGWGGFNEWVMRGAIEEYLCDA